VCSEDVKAFVLPPCYASQDKPHRECGTATSVNNLTRIPNQLKASQGRKIYAGIKMHKCQVKKFKKQNTQEILPQKKKKEKVHPSLSYNTLVYSTIPFIHHLTLKMQETYHTTKQSLSSSTA
jgi:hypothetical protein